MAPTSIKTSLLLIAQLKLALGLALAPRAVTCNYETAASSGDTCTSFAADWGLTLATFESLNPTAACPTLVVGQSYCVVGTVTAATTTTSSTSSTTSTTSTSSSSSSTSAVSVTTTSSAPYQPQQTGTAVTCSQFYLVESGDSCVIIENLFDITSTEFLAWNPSINSDCTNILAGYYYCVDIPGATKAATTTTAPATTTVPADGVTTPSPIQTGMTTTCNKFQLVVSGDTCAAIATANNISLANFYAWNPAVGSSCATLGLGYYVCVDIIGNTATATTTTSAGNGITTPTPFEPGMVSDCNKFYFVVSGDTCSGIATSQGITVADIELWNPQVGTACTDIWLSDYICVGV